MTLPEVIAELERRKAYYTAEADKHKLAGEAEDLAYCDGYATGIWEALELLRLLPEGSP